MPDPDALWKDVQKLDDLYEELLWHPDDELQFTHDGQRIIITNKTYGDSSIYENTPSNNEQFYLTLGEQQ